jgi:hypothetical protein
MEHDPVLIFSFQLVQNIFSHFATFISTGKNINYCFRGDRDNIQWVNPYPLIFWKVDETPLSVRPYLYG